MFMPMMRIRKMRVAVRQRQMAVRVAVRHARWGRCAVRVIVRVVLFICTRRSMRMRMVVLERRMHVLVLVALSQMQQHANSH